MEHESLTRTGTRHTELDLEWQARACQLELVLRSHLISSNIHLALPAHESTFSDLDLEAAAWFLVATSLVRKIVLDPGLKAALVRRVVEDLL